MTALLQLKHAAKNWKPFSDNCDHKKLQRDIIAV